jgi:hypothetical protein
LGVVLIYCIFLLTYSWKPEVMATSTPSNPPPATGSEPKYEDGARNDHIERVETGPSDDAIFSKFPKMDKVDEFGAHAKTDPREIALVKKLDKYIIVSICATDDSSVTSNVCLAHVVAYVLVQLSRS